MDIIAFSTELERQMRENLNLVIKSAGSASVPSLTARRLAVIAGSINELRDFVYRYKFSDVEQEIKFFKEIKPVFLSQYLYQKKVYQISLCEQFMAKDERLKYYHSVLKSMLRYAKRHHEFYLYCMAGETKNDALFFARLKKESDPMRDQLFTTARDGQLATLLSHNLINDHINEAIRGLNSEFMQPSALTWTGKKSELVELLFALHATGSFNNADAEVKQIAMTFEHVFHVDLGNQYDYLQKMRGRKTGQVAFLEKMRTKLLQRLDQLDQD